MINTLITVNIYGLASSRNMDRSIFAVIQWKQGHCEDSESYSGKWPAASLILVEGWSRPALMLSLFAIICGAFPPQPERIPRAPRLTKNRSGRNRLPVKPEGDLGQDDRHNAG